MHIRGSLGTLSMPLRFDFSTLFFSKYWKTSEFICYAIRLVINFLFFSTSVKLKGTSEH